MILLFCFSIATKISAQNSNITISTAVNTNGVWSGVAPNRTYTPTADNAVLNVTTLQTELATNNVTIVTARLGGAQPGNITFSNAVTSNSASGATQRTLTLNAGGSIAINAVLNLTGAAGATANPATIGGSGKIITFTAGTTINVAASISTNGGNGGNGNGANRVGAAGGVGGGITFSAGNNVTINQPIVSSGGNGGNGSGTGAGGNGGNAGSIVITSTGGITLTNNCSANGGSVGTGGSPTAGTMGNFTLNDGNSTVTTGGGVNDGQTAGIISGGTLTKTGTGTFNIAGANTYIGLTTISAGTLRLGAAGSGTNTPLGTIVSGTTVTAGAVLDLNGFTLGTTESLLLNGTGISNGGALTNSSVVGLSYNGAITLGSASSIGTTGDITLGNGVTGTQNLTKVGAGALFLGTGTSTFNNLTISTGTFTSTSGTLNIAGDFSNNGTFTHNGGTVIFNGAAQIIANVTYNNLTLSGSNTKSLNGSTRINGVLTLTNGILALGSYDLTLSGGANCSGTFSATNMIDIGSGSVIKEGNNNSDFVLTFPIGIGAAYTPMQLASFSATTIAPTSTIKIQSSATAAVGVPGDHPLNRQWVTSTTGITGSLLADVLFLLLPGDIPVGGTASLYEIVFQPTAGTWGVPIGANAAGSNPLRASSTTTLDATWTGTEPIKRVFYSLKTGSWDDPTTWTLDPSGTQPLNPNNVTPTTSLTSAFDEIVVLSGRTVTVPTNTKINNRLTVIGTLDLGATTGHTFTAIYGTGRIRLAADNFPLGDATDFITAGQGEGTVEYYGTTRSLSVARTYYNVDVNMSAANTLTLLKDYTINGNLKIINGTLSINDNTATTNLNINIIGNITVAAAGKIITGNANARHQLNIYGDFTNSGDVRFTNRITADYSTEAIDGIVDANFLSTDKSQSIMCRGISNFYRIEIDKGTDYTYTLNIDATAPANFNLFGYASDDHSPAVSQLTDNNNALGLVKGSVRIGNSVIIPTLSTANIYSISSGAQLWIDRGTVQKNIGQTIAIYGKVKITNGTLEAKTTSGITFRSSGILSVEGGTVNTNQIRTSDIGAANYGGYVQTSGAVNVLGGTTDTDYYVFSLPYPNSVFNMSGGTLTVNTSLGNGGILINSDPENIKVTGGMVIAETNNTEDFLITSTAPFWNLSLKNPTAIARQFTLGSATNIAPDNINVAAQPLKVLNDFRIWGLESGGVAYPAITFTTGTNDVYIGGSFYVESGAQYIPISGGTAPYDAIANQPTASNSTYFNKTTGTSAVEVFYIGETAIPLELGKLVVDRTAGYEVEVTSGAARVNESVALDVNGSASVLSGILNQNLFTIRTWGAITNNDRMGTWYPGVTPSRAQIQMVENPLLTLTTSSGAVFGNIQINVSTSAKLTLTSNTYIERMEYVKGLIYLKNYNLKVDNMWNMETGLFENSTINSYLNVSDNGYSGSSMIFTDGKASDGGLSIKVTANSQAENQNNILNNFGPITYPIGFTADGGTTLYFRPAQVVVKDITTSGYITIRTILGPLQTTNQTGSTEILQHYWRVTHSGFTTLPTVAYRYYYRNQIGTANVDLLAGSVNEVSYVPGKVLDESPYTRLYEPLSDNDVIKAFGAGGNSRFITINGTSTNGLFTPASAGITLENANYSTGIDTRFIGSVLIYYSIDNATYDGGKGAPWNRAASWTRSDILNPALTSPHNSSQPQSATIPGAGDVVVIGWVPWDDPKVALRGQPHCIWLTDSRQVAEVVFTKMTDISGNPVPRFYRSNFQFRPTLTINGRGEVNTYDADGLADNGILTAKLVKGEGLFWDRQSDPDYTIMDVGDFALQDSSYVIYENFTNNRIINNTPTLLPNIYISNDGWGNNDHNFTFARNITTTGNVELLGDVNLTLPTGATGDFTVGRNLVMFENNTPSASGGGARIDFGNIGTARKIIIKGNLIMKNSNSIIQVINPNATAPLVDHELHIEGNIIQGTAGLSSTGLDLWSGANNDRITLFLDGNSNMTYSLVNGTIPDLYRLVVNKGSSSASTAQFNSDFVLNGPTTGLSVPKALELRNGTFINNNPNAARVLNLTTGNDYFDIPSTAGLDIRQGTARASGTSGISLDGKLTISGGILDMSGGDNPIEYSASGNASISVTSGTLTVGGQIRRSPTSEVGILSYSQTNGTVVVGSNIASVGNRGVFEILNASSSFTMTGGDLYIVRSQASPTISSFYFDPATYNIGLAANINIGHSLTPGTQSFGIYAGKPLPRLRINNQSGNNPIAKLETIPATITSLLQIDAGATLNANGIDLTLKGDMTASGTYIPNGNITLFSGSIAQTITGNGTTLNFFDLDKTTSNNLILNAGNTSLMLANTLSLRGGTFTDNGNTIVVKGDVLNDGTHINNGAGDGISLKGDVAQILTGNGTFGKLTINNLNGVNIPVGNQFFITRSLKMQAGVLNIGKNILDIGLNAVIEETSPFSKTNMIETNISFTDKGLRKTFPAGPSPIFTFPVGSNDKYTPITITISANDNSTGSITVKPANEIHPSIIEDPELGTQIVDKNNALQYYWTLKANGISGFSAIAKMRYIDTDIKVTAPYTIADYHTAGLLANGLGNWLKFPKTDFDATNKDLIYNYSGKDDSEISGDYTAGAGDIFLNGAIPDIVSKYETNTNGDWNTGAIWTPNVTGGPYGAIAKINALHTVDVTTDYIAGYLTEVFGTLKLYSTFGHRLGIVDGTGTIYLEVGDIPAAVYDDFFSSAGGTLEFGGLTSYELLGNITEVNHLKFTGIGDRKLPNNNITLNGDLTIDGGAGLNVINYYNRKTSIKGDLRRTTGGFEAGSGANATLAFTGTLLQTITGSFSNSNALNNLEINNSNSIDILNDVEIDRELKLTNGLVNVTTGSLFRINYIATVSPAIGTPSSFVNGVLTKELMNGNSFTFPIGNKSTSQAHGPISLQSITGPAGINDWKASYFYANPDIAGFTTTSFVSPITTVSSSEYWKIEAPTGGASIISILLDGSSDVGNTIPNLNNLRVVGWNASSLKWEVVGISATISGTSINGTITTTAPVNFGSYTYFTLASITPLSVSSASFTSPAIVNLCNGSSTTMVVAFSGTAPWVLTYTAGASTITTPALAVSPYNIVVAPASTTIYTLTGITANGTPGTITGTTFVTVNVNPIPIVSISSNDADNTICQGTSITFTAPAGLTNYRFRVNGTTAQNGASRTYTTTTLAAGAQSVDVIGTNAGGCSATSSALAVTVNPLPSAAGVISGSASVCITSNATYTVPAIANATSYTWTKTNGATGASVTNSINLNFPNAGNSVITVSGTNGCGNGVVSTVTVAVNVASPAGAAGAISGVTDVCKGGTGYAFSVAPITNATSYIWSYSGAGASINGTGSSVTVDFSAGATSGNLTVAGTNGCSTGTVSPNYGITVNNSPTATILPAAPATCSGTAITITATPAGGTAPYTTHAWTGTGSGSLSSTTIVNPSFNNAIGGSYGLNYTVTDTKGCTGSASTTVTVYQAPIANAGPDALNLCTGAAPIVMTGATAGGSYSGTPTWSGLGGTWTQNPDPALASFTPSSVSGSTTVTLTLTGANGCTNATDTRDISWSKIPDQPGAFTVSSASVCQGQTGVTYTIPNDPIVTTYNWTYTVGSGATISGTGNSISIDFSAIATTGKINVTATNSCGTSPVRTMDITVETTPAASILFGNTSTCAGTLGDGFTVTFDPTWTYSWSIEDAVGTVVAPGNTSSVTINWNANATIVWPALTPTFVIKKVSAIVNTTPVGCPITLEWNVTINRVPITGPQYHVPNAFGL